LFVVPDEVLFPSFVPEEVGGLTTAGAGLTTTGAGAATTGVCPKVGISAATTGAGTTMAGGGS
jgi:hypothetical protein